MYMCSFSLGVIMCTSLSIRNTRLFIEIVPFTKYFLKGIEVTRALIITTSLLSVFSINISIFNSFFFTEAIITPHNMNNIIRIILFDSFKLMTSFTLNFVKSKFQAPYNLPNYIFIFIIKISVKVSNK